MAEAVKPGELEVGDVVQLDPAAHMPGAANDGTGGFFAGCFMIVEEIKVFGAQGFICMPGKRGEAPGRAYFRAKWEDMVKIGKAEWT